MIDVTNKRFVIFGLQGSGKTVLAKHILTSTKHHIVYDPMHEYEGYRRYLPGDRQSTEELNTFVQDVVIKYKPVLFLTDEANKYIGPKPSPLPPAIADLNDLSRHWGVAWGMVTRRPVQFHSDVTELAHYLFVFRLPGKNDRQYLNNLKSGLGDAVATLPDHHFMVVGPQRDYYIHSPVDIPASKAIQ